MTDRPEQSSGDPEGQEPEGTGGAGRPEGGEGTGLPPELRELLGALTGGAAIDPRSLDPGLLDPQAVKALQDQLEAMGLGRVDPGALQSMAAQVRAMFAQPVEGPLNAALALDTARRVVSSEGDSSVRDGARRHVVDSVNVADLWLDDVTALPAPAAPAHAWSRTEWVEATMPVWRTIVAPIAEGVATAVGAAIRQQVEQLGAEALPEGMLPEGVDPAALVRQMEPMLGSMSASMFGVQLGQAIGTLAGDILSGTEVGLPLVADHGVALVPVNVAEFAQGLGIDEEQVRLYLAVRESARSRLFAGAPWLAPQLLTAVQDYARDIRIDTEAIEAQLQSVDPSDPQALQEALQHSLFSPTPSEAQKAALGRLETLLALVEGWVDTVAARASTPHLPQADALGEAMRRRRASGGPAEKTFSALVGLELRGAAARDAAWGHPDIAPTAADLDDPLGFVEKVTGRAASDDVDVALDEILRGDAGDH